MTDNEKIQWMIDNEIIGQDENGFYSSISHKYIPSGDTAFLCAESDSRRMGERVVRAHLGDGCSVHQEEYYSTFDISGTDSAGTQYKYEVKRRDKEKYTWYYFSKNDPEVTYHKLSDDTLLIYITSDNYAMIFDMGKPDGTNVKAREKTNYGDRTVRMQKNAFFKRANALKTYLLLPNNRIRFII